MVDDDSLEIGGAQQADQPEDMGRMVFELVEALSALGNYVEAAARISDGAAPIGTDIRKVLEAASGQHERAAMALRRLRGLLTADNIL